jgi:hypothetical protein
MYKILIAIIATISISFSVEYEIGKSGNFNTINQAIESNEVKDGDVLILSDLIYEIGDLEIDKNVRIKSEESIVKMIGTLSIKNADIILENIQIQTDLENNIESLNVLNSVVTVYGTVDINGTIALNESDFNNFGHFITGN